MELNKRSEIVQEKLTLTKRELQEVVALFNNHSAVRDNVNQQG